MDLNKLFNVPAASPTGRMATVSPELQHINPLLRKEDGLRTFTQATDFSSVESRVTASYIAGTRFQGPRFDKLRADYLQAEKRVAIRQGQKDTLQRQRDNAIIERAEAQKALDVNDLVQILLQKTSDFARQQAKKRIEDIVTSALTVVFGKDYGFRLELEVRSNRPELDYYLESEGLVTQLKPPDYDRGGGVVDVVSLALRLAVAELEGVTGTLWLDEVGKHVSAEFAPNVAYFLKEYSAKFGRQMVLITHNEALSQAGDRSLVASQKNGKSEVRVL